MPSTISIVVCARNEEECLESTLESLAKQTVVSDLIVVNNDSEDATRSIALRFTNCVLDCKTRGKVACMKMGADAASGDIVALADADTIYPTDWTLKIRSAFEKNPSAQLVFGPSAPASGKERQYWSGRLATSIFFRISLQLGVVCSLGFNLAARRAALAKVLHTFPPVAYSGWGIGTAVFREWGRSSVLFDSNLEVPKCMRRYKKHGIVRTTVPWCKEWARLAFGGELRLMEHDYYDR